MALMLKSLIGCCERITGASVSGTKIGLNSFVRLWSFSFQWPGTHYGIYRCLSDRRRIWRSFDAARTENTAVEGISRPLSVTDDTAQTEHREMRPAPAARVPYTITRREFYDWRSHLSFATWQPRLILARHWMHDVCRPIQGICNRLRRIHTPF